jgi:hypothetical protein
VSMAAAIGNRSAASGSTLSLDDGPVRAGATEHAGMVVGAGMLGDARRHWQGREASGSESRVPASSAAQVPAQLLSVQRCAGVQLGCVLDHYAHAQTTHKYASLAARAVMQQPPPAITGRTAHCSGGSLRRPLHAPISWPSMSTQAPVLTMAVGVAPLCEEDTGLVRTSSLVGASTRCRQPRWVGASRLPASHRAAIATPIVMTPLMPFACASAIGTVCPAPARPTSARAAARLRTERCLALCGVGGGGRSRVAAGGLDRLGQPALLGSMPAQQVLVGGREDGRAVRHEQLTLTALGPSES